MRAALALAVMVLTTACGQTGSLYLPDDAVKTPVEIRTPGTVPPSEPKEAEKKKDEPPGR
ncbi:MAG: LPS translocon maturation chaperone LptM [Steroidobacteraceae bacterium]